MSAFRGRRGSGCVRRRTPRCANYATRRQIGGPAATPINVPIGGGCFLRGNTGHLAAAADHAEDDAEEGD